MKIRLCKLLQKQNGSIYEGSIGQTRDSPITKSGYPYAPDHPITARGGTVTYQDAVASNDNAVPPASPAIAGNTNWDPREAKDAILKWATDDRGNIQDATRFFLIGDGQNPKSYQVPLAIMNDRGQPQYFNEALDRAWRYASDEAANRTLQNKVIFIKQRYNMPLTDEQQRFVSCPKMNSSFERWRNTMIHAEREAAVKSLHETLRTIAEGE